MTLFEFIEKHKTSFYDTKSLVQLSKHHKISFEKVIDLADEILDRNIIISEKDLIDEISKKLNKIR